MKRTKGKKEMLLPILPFEKIPVNNRRCANGSFLRSLLSADFLNNQPLQLLKSADKGERSRFSRTIPLAPLQIHQKFNLHFKNFKNQ